MQRSSLLRQARVHRPAALIIGGLVAEAGCLWIWHEAPRLTVIYNADYTNAFFAALPWLAPVADRSRPTDAADSVVRLLAGVLLASLGYVLALSAGGRGAAWLSVGFAALFRVTLVLLPGLFSTDVFSYVMYGRIAAVYGQNPYVQPPSAFPADPFLTWVFPFWRVQPSVYGPVWTDLSQGLSAVTATWSPFAQVIAYRSEVIGCEAACLVALWWLLGRLQRRERSRLWLLYAWNPLVVFDLVGAAHNDAVMLMLLLLGLLVFYRWRGIGLGLVALSALVKFATALAVPLLAFAWAASAGDSRERTLRLSIGLGVPLAIVAALWWPWLAASPDALAALREMAAGRLVLNSAPYAIADAFADEVQARFWIGMLMRGAFAVWFAVELVHVWRSPGKVLASATRLLLGLPLLVLTWVWSWYFSWSLAVAVLLGMRSRLLRLVVAYTLVVPPVVYAHQYLNEQLPGAWVVGMALGPLVTLIPIRRLAAARTLIKTGGGQAMNLRTLPPSWGIALVRVMAGLIIMVAGLEKWAAGGLTGFTQGATGMGLPLAQLWGVYIPLQEFIGGFLILTGLGARWVAILFVIEYFVTSFLLKAVRPAPFGGWDSMRIDLMLWVAVIAVAAVGPGAFALESWILRRGRADLPMAGRAVPG
jgi:alpha-1,6-mannosyltransferase